MPWRSAVVALLKVKDVSFCLGFCFYPLPSPPPPARLPACCAGFMRLWELPLEESDEEEEEEGEAKAGAGGSAARADS